jgi:hypothetical protein
MVRSVVGGTFCDTLTVRSFLVSRNPFSRRLTAMEYLIVAVCTFLPAFIARVIAVYTARAAFNCGIPHCSAERNWNMVSGALCVLGLIFMVILYLRELL